MEELKPGQLPAPKNEGERLAQLRMIRAMALIAEIPTEYGERPARAWAVWAQIVTQLYGKRGLLRVVAPWLLLNKDPKCPPYLSAGRWRRMLRSEAPRVSRGRASNPTAR